MKTLQDIPLGISKTININVRYKLRQEAITWVKEFKKPEGFDRINIKLNSEIIEFNDWNSVPLIEWITHFFNITEEDLK